ncbi:MAG TPA: hypothetical protein VKS81_04925, partial [Bacteroidota bacterium]|nr:hypothetical protein [Bacteroidota bacterium]
MSQRIAGFVFLLVGVAFFIYFVNTTKRDADMLLVNGTVYTLDPQNTVAQAVAIRGNRIVATGTTEDLTEDYKSDTTIDL